MERRQKKSRDLLHGKYKEFGHFGEKLDLASSMYEFFYIMCECVAPLLRQGRSFEAVHNEYAIKISNHDMACSQARLAACEEVKNVYLSLSVAFDREEHLNDELFRRNLAYLGEIVTTFDNTTTTPFIKMGASYVEQLCCQLLYLGREDLVTEYAALQAIKEHRVDEQTGRVIVDAETGNAIFDEQKIISQFKFAPSLYKLIGLEEVYSGEKCSEEWVAARFIFHAEWCWNTPQAYFEDKKLDMMLNYSDTVNSLNHQIDWMAMSIIRKQEDNNIVENSLFTRERYLRFFDLIFDKLVVEQGMVNTQDVPYAIELKFLNSQLFLAVENTKEPTDIQAYLLKTCNDQGTTSKGKLRKSAPHKVIDCIIAAEDGALIDLEKLLVVTGDGKGDGKAKQSKPSLLYASYCMEKMNFRGVSQKRDVLEKIFFKKVQGSTITMRSKRVVLSEVPGLDFNDLKTCLQELKVIDVY